MGELRREGIFDPEVLQVKLVRKQLYIKIGLDIGWLASRRIVDKMVIYTEDPDWIPAIEFARKEGLMVYSAQTGPGINYTLNEHCDGIIEIKL